MDTGENEMTKKTPPSIGQFALSERDDLLATIAEQSREIERLLTRIAEVEKQNHDLIERFAPYEIQDAMKAKPGAVVLPDILFDGFTVYEEVLKGREQQRTSHENVSDTLDAIVRLLRRANPDSARLNVSRVPEGWQLVPLNPAKFLDMGFAYIDAARESEPNMRWAFSHAGYKAMLSAAPAPTVEPAHSAGVALANTRTGRVYIAGPMTGYENYNFAAFNAEAERLRGQGLHVENPADHGVVSSADWADYLRYDIGRLATCERIHLLPGWSKSKGATLEVHIAQALGMTISYAEGAEPAHSNAVLIDQELFDGCEV
jgi:hypothetical protein